MWTSILSIAIVINEIMASNAGSVMSPAINFDSWIELYNPTEQAVNLSGMYLSDDGANLKRWQMPNHIGTIPSKGYLVVWMGSNDLKSNQAPFKLDCDGGTVYLSDKSGSLVTSQEYPAAMSRTSWARKSVDSEAWGRTADVTPGASNATATFADTRLDAPVVNVDSKLFTNTLNVKVSIPNGATLMYTTDGSLPTAPKSEGQTSPWKEFVVNGDSEGPEAVSLVSRNAGGSGDSYVITDGAGVNGSRGIKIHAVQNPTNPWDAQFFVYTPDHKWQPGEKYRFRMMVRADKNAYITTQTHGKPHDYITNDILDAHYNITTEWQEIKYEGVITEGQSGFSYDRWSGQTKPARMQSIVFNLNEDRQENNFYFDNVSWELDTSGGTVEEASKKSEDGQFIISNTTNLTLRLFKDGYLPSVPVTRSYIKTSNQYTLPIVSIVGDQKYFTDPKIGFDCDGDGTNGAVASYTNGQKRNYAQDWDRPVNFSYISPDGKMLYNQDVNIKVSGGYTRTLDYHSFKLKAGKVFDGQNHFDYPFFPQKPYTRNKTLLIRNGGNDMWRHDARFIDAALETVIQRSGLDVDVQSYVPVIEYVNGELRGVFNLREPNNDDFAYANWGYDDEELDALENMTIKNGDDAAIKRIFELGKNATNAAAYEELKTLLDIDEFTNYMAVTFYLYNDDWPDNNIKAYRSRNDGRYRFVSFDLDYAFKGCWDYSGDNPFTTFEKFKDDATAPRTSYNKDIVNLFLNLLKNDEYRRKFIDTYCIVGGSVFEATRASKIVNELVNNVKGMCQLMNNIAGWGSSLGSGNNVERAAKTIKDNLNSSRSNTMTNYMKQFSPMQLGSATRQSVTLKADAEGAQLFVNGINVPYADFKGHLFAPVTLRAEAPAGYRFAGWKQGSNIVSTDTEMSLPSGSVTLTATFTKLSDSEKNAQGITPVRINEVSADDGIYVNDYFKRKDWVELYNTTDQPVNVEGMYLSDKPEDPKKYQISKDNSQASTTIPAHGYLIVWCDKESPLSQLHASFKLDKDGGEIVLTAADESWADHFVYAAHTSDQTVGRYPDGSSQVYVMNMPTIAKSNVFSSYAVNVEQPGTVSGISDRMATQEDADRIYNLKGQTVQGNLKPGIYIVNGRKFIKK